MPPVDKSILSSKQNQGDSYLDELAFAVCVNGELLEKYEKFVIKQYDEDVLNKMKRFVDEVQKCVRHQKFTGASRFVLEHLGGDVGISKEVVESVITKTIELCEHPIDNKVVTLSNLNARETSVSLFFQQFVDALFEDVVLNDLPLTNQSNILYRFAENEGLNLKQFKEDFETLFYLLEVYSKQHNKSTKLAIIGQAELCYVSNEQVLHVLSQIEDCKKEQPGKLVVVRKDGKYGFIDCNTLEVKIPFVWQHVYTNSSSEGMTRVKDENGKYTFLDENGNILPGRWECTYDYTEGLAVVKDSNGKYGAINKKGELVIPCQWDYLGEFSNGLAHVEKKSYYGLIGKDGDVVMTCKWKSIESFSDGLALVCNNKGKYGFINMTGELVIPCRWKLAYGFTEGLAPVCNDRGDYGYIDKRGNLLIPYKFSRAMCFSEGMALVRDKSGEYGFINKNGDWMISCHSKSWRMEGVCTGFFKDGLAVVVDADGIKYGYMNKAGEMITPYQWETALTFKNGLAPVERESKYPERSWQFINKKGELMSPFIWKNYDPPTFCEGMAAVKDEDEKWGFIDTSFQIMIPCLWESVYSFSNGYAAVEMDGKWGYVDKNGQVVIPCQWKDCMSFKEGIASVTDDNGRAFVINLKGEILREL